MALEIDGKTVQTTETGYLANDSDWTEAVATEIARLDGLEPLTQEHWDVVNFLREEFYNNNQHQPNDREINKFCSEK